MLGPVQAITTCFTKSFRFLGRATRAEFWWSFVGLYFLISVLLMYRGLPFTGPRTDGILTILTYALIIPLLAVGTRRLADAGMPRWIFVVAWVLGQMGMVLYMIQMPSISDLYAMSFQAERNDTWLPLSGYEMHHALRALRDDVLPWASRGLAILGLGLALLPTKQSSHPSSNVSNEVQQ